MVLDLRAGPIRKIQPPVDPAQFGGATNPMLDISAVGSPDTVRRQLAEFVERTRRRRAHHRHLRLSLNSPMK